MFFKFAIESERIVKMSEHFMKLYECVKVKRLTVLWTAAGRQTDRRRYGSVCRNDATAPNIGWRIKSRTYAICVDEQSDSFGNN